MLATASSSRKGKASPSKQTVSASKLYQGYLGWCGQAGEKPEANNIFARHLAVRGVAKKRGRRGVHYQGVGLVAPGTANGEHSELD
jgi:hypothetical protein